MWGGAPRQGELGRLFTRSRCARRAKQDERSPQRQFALSGKTETRQEAGVIALPEGMLPFPPHL